MQRRSIIYDPRLASSKKDIKRLLIPHTKDDNNINNGEDDFADDVENDLITGKLTV
jgi:hypothetical protein